MHFYIRPEQNGRIGLSNYHKSETYPVLRGDRFEREGNILSSGYVEIGGTIHQITSTEHGFKVIKARNNYDPVLDNWGYILTRSNKGICEVRIRYMCNIRDASLVNWMMNYLNKALGGTPKLLPLRLRCIDPFRSEKFVGKISLTKSYEDRVRARETALKVGKAFKFIMPELNSDELGAMVDAYNIRWGGRDFKVHTSRDPKVFASVYKEKNQALMQNPRTTHERKSIACSCMRYEFEDQPYHPAYVYGSGDFEIYYTADGEGQIGSRCVVYNTDKTDRPQAGPIYGVCEESMNLIQRELDKINAECIRPNWVGARLLHIPHNDGVIGPYLDVEPRSLAIVNDLYLEVSHNGDYDASEYGGVLGDSYRCDDCGTNVCEDNVRCYEDETYCEDCFCERYDYCEWPADYLPHDQMVCVYPHEYYVWEGCENLAQCTDGEWWDTEHCYYVEGENVWISEDTYSEDYFTSDWDNEVYHNDDAAHTVDGELVGIVEVEDAGYKKNDDEKWYDPQGELDLEEGDKK